MKLFIDTANLHDIEEALKSGCVRGVTTNPSLLAKEPKGSYLEHMSRVVELAAPHQASVSIEVFTNDPGEMIRQAEQFQKTLNYKFLAVKIPISCQGQHNLGVVADLASKGIAVNCTACMTPLQAAMAASAGATYVSLFYNRIRDGATQETAREMKNKSIADGLVEEEDFDPDHVIRETRALLSDSPKAEIIAGSIRSVVDVKRALLSGAHIVTASAKILSAATGHFKTDEAVLAFLADFKSWLS
jgi:transaldolase